MKRRKNVVIIDEVETKPALVQGGDDFDKCLKLFLGAQKLKNLAFHTLRWHRENLSYLKKYFEEQSIDTAPIRITTSQIKQNFILYMLEAKNLSPVTINGRIRSTKLFFRFLREEGYAEKDPAEKLILLKTKKTIIQALSPEQVRDLLKQPNKNMFTGFRDYLILLLLLETGARVSELKNLKVNDIRLNENLILFCGKGNKERLVPFQRTIKDALKKYLAIRGDIKDNPYLLCTIDNTTLVLDIYKKRFRITVS